MNENGHPPQIQRSSSLGLFLGLICGIGFLTFMVLVSGGFFLYVLLAVLGVGGLGSLHYWLWGEALERESAAERARAAAEERRELDLPPPLPRRSRPGSDDPHIRRF